MSYACVLCLDYIKILTENSESDPTLEHPTYSITIKVRSKTPGTLVAISDQVSLTM